MADAIEAMNKLRKSLGLPLLGGDSSSIAQEGPQFKSTSQPNGEDDEPASTIDTREAAGYSNLANLRAEEKRQLEREQRKKAIQKARDNATRMMKLEGKGLGEAGSDEEGDGSAKAWLRGQKKRQKEIERQRAERMQRELEEREREAAVEYTSKDLSGVKVAHGIEELEENGEDGQVLTLQDREIGLGSDDEEEGDLLESADMVAKEKLKDKLEAKKRVRYDVHDDEKGELLAQYDDKKRKAFTLDAMGSSVEERERKKAMVGEKLRDAISLDVDKILPESDYLEVKMKKPKKTKKNKRVKEVDQEDIFPVHATHADSMALDSGVTQSRPKSRDTFLDNNDDEDLATALSRSRRQVLKKKKIKPEDLVAQLKAEDHSEPVPEEDGAFILDDTRVFLDNLDAHPEDTKLKSKQETPHSSIEVKPEPTSPTSDHEMPDREYAITEDNEAALLDQLRRDQPPSTPEHTTTGLDEEKPLSSGVGAALSLLRSRGLVTDNASNSAARNAAQRARQTFLAESRLREHEDEARARQQRERDRLSGKSAGLSLREREEAARLQNEHRAQQGSIAAAAAFNRNYRPDVELKYVDDDGRSLNQKEAFKHLSHQFHGKGSGKGKTEKHLKKVADEKKREAKSILDSNTEGTSGLRGALGEVGKRDRVAGVRLQ